jgi:hypothetical protein
MNKTKLTVIIPSYERQEYLIYAIKSCLSYDFINVIVKDNSSKSLNLDLHFDNNELNKIKYHHTSDCISVVENFTIDPDELDSDYVCFIGDDDCLGPGVDYAIKQMHRHSMDSLMVKSGSTLHYFWEGSKHPFWGNTSNNLYLDKFTSVISKINIEERLDLCNKRLGMGPMGLPRLYLGIIRTNLFQSICNDYGNIFGGYSPDIYSSILLSYSGKSFYEIDYPIIIPGACKKSTSGLRSERKDVSSLKGDNHLQRFKSIDWDESIPMIYSPYTVWGITHIMALKKLKIEFSNTYLLGKLLLEIPPSRKDVLKKLKFFSFGKMIKFLIFLTQIIFLRVNNICRSLIKMNPGGADIKVENLETIIDSVNYIKTNMPIKKL